MAHAQGDFIQWLDADDILAPDKIEIQLTNSDCWSQSRILHSSSWAPFYYRINKAKFISDPLWQDLTPLEWLLKHIGEGYYMFPAPWLVSRRLTELAGPWDESLLLNQDGEYFFRVVASSDYIKFNPNAKSYYRKGNLSSTSSLRYGKRLISLNAAKNTCVDALLKLEDSERTRKACVSYLKKMNYSLFLNDQNSPLIKENEKKILKLGGKIERYQLTTKFNFVQRIIGLRKASLVKTKLWHAKILFHKNIDKFLYLFSSNRS